MSVGEVRRLAGSRPGPVKPEFTHYRELLRSKMEAVPKDAQIAKLVGAVWRHFEEIVVLNKYNETPVDSNHVRITLDLSLFILSSDGEIGKVEWSDENRWLAREGAKRVYHAVHNRLPHVAKDVELIQHGGAPALLLRL